MSAPANPWIEWSGGRRPEDWGVLVEVRLRCYGNDDHQRPRPAGEFDWKHSKRDRGQDIISYRVVQS